MTTKYAATARRYRAWSIAMFVAAGVFAVLGVVFLVINGKPTDLMTVSSAAMILICGFSLRQSARSLDLLSQGD